MHFGFAVPLIFAMVLCVLALAWLWHSDLDTASGHGQLRISLHEPFAIFAHARRHCVIRGLPAAFFLFQFGFAIYYVS